MSHHELIPITAPVIPMESCIKPFLEKCDSDSDGSITIHEWGRCLGLKEGQLDGRCICFMWVIYIFRWNPGTMLEHQLSDDDLVYCTLSSIYCLAVICWCLFSDSPAIIFLTLVPAPIIYNARLTMVLSSVQDVLLIVSNNKIHTWYRGQHMCVMALFPQLGVSIN